MQNWLQANFPGSLKLSRSEPTGPARLDYHAWGAMLEKYLKLQPKPKATDELKVALYTTSEVMPQEHINKAVANFTKCLAAYMVVAANDGHFEHLQ